MNAIFRNFALSVSLFAVCTAMAAPRPRVEFDKNQGSVVVYDAFDNPAWCAGFRISHFDEKFKPMKQFVFDGVDGVGRLTTADDSRGMVKIDYEQKSSTQAHVTLTFSADKPVSTGRLMYEEFIPGTGMVVTVNGKVYDYGKPFDPKNPYQVVIPALADGSVTTVIAKAPNATWTLTGKFAVILQDMRKWSEQGGLQLRLMFTPYQGEISNGSLEYDISVTPNQ